MTTIERECWRQVLIAIAGYYTGLSPSHPNFWLMIDIMCYISKEKLR